MSNHIIDTPRCNLFVPMGMGKSVATLTALDTLFLGGESKPALVIAPLRVAKNTWPLEARKWQHLRHISVMPIIGNEDERRAALRFDASVYTINYENIEWLVNHYGERWPFSTVVADESTRLKNFRLKQGGRRARALGRVAHTKIKRYVGLTGTPAPNGLANLWGQMWFVDAGRRLGASFEAFKNRWFQVGYDGHGLKHLEFAEQQIHDKIRDVCLAIDPADYFDLDAPIIVNRYVDLPPKARIKYREMEKDMFTQIEGDKIEAFGAAARTQKCLQLANGAVYLNPKVEGEDDPRSREWKEVHDEKINELASIVEELNGAPLIVAYEFKSDLARIKRAFPEAKFFDDSRETEDTWNRGGISMLLAHPKSAGHGSNLQDGGHHICFFGHNWDLELYQQIIERIGPMRQMQSGHKRSVFIYHIIARDTVDELVMARRESKRSVQEILLDAMKRRKQ